MLTGFLVFISDISCLKFDIFNSKPFPGEEVIFKCSSNDLLLILFKYYGNLAKKIAYIKRNTIDSSQTQCWLNDSSPSSSYRILDCKDDVPTQLTVSKMIVDENDSGKYFCGTDAKDTDVLESYSQTKEISVVGVLNIY